MTVSTNDISFGHKETIPDDQKLRKAFGLVYPAYREILTLTEAYSREWKLYGAKFGWQLKVMRKGKALLYLTPQEGSFRLAFAVREEEKEALLNSKLPAKLRGELKTVKKYPEGYPLRLQVKKESAMRAARLVIETLKAFRR